MRLLIDTPGKQTCFPPRTARKRGEKRKRTGNNTRDAPECIPFNAGHDHCDTILIAIEYPRRIFITFRFLLVHGENRTRNVSCSFKNVA